MLKIFPGTDWKLNKYNFHVNFDLRVHKGKITKFTDAVELEHNWDTILLITAHLDVSYKKKFQTHLLGKPKVFWMRENIESWKVTITLEKKALHCKKLINFLSEG